MFTNGDVVFHKSNPSISWVVIGVTPTRVTDGVNPIDSHLIHCRTVVQNVAPQFASTEVLLKRFDITELVRKQQ